MPNKRWSRDIVERHSVDMRQFADFRQSVLPNGMRIIEAYNSSGLSLSLLPDRGCDVWQAQFNGLPLTWISQGAPFPPDNGQPWLRQFNGGLLITCGLTHVGPPETDPETGEGRDLHGRYTRLPAHDLQVQRQWVTVDGNERYQISLHAKIAQSAMFGEQLLVDRTYRMTLGEPAVELVDVVHNLSDEPAPLMLLYHCNLGYPLIAEGTRLYTAYQQVYARDARAREGLDHWDRYDAVTPQFAEQVYFHHVKTNADGWSQAALLQKDFGLVFSWDASTLPCLTQWKNTRQGITVCGIEPGNCLPEGQNAARQQGRLVLMEPGEQQTFTLKITALQGEQALAASRDQIETLRVDGKPITNCKLDDYAG